MKEILLIWIFWVKISSLPLLSCKIGVIFMLLWVLIMTKNVFFHQWGTIENLQFWMWPSNFGWVLQYVKLNILQDKKYSKNGERKGRKASVFVFVMNLNHSCNSSFWYFKNKTFGNGWCIWVDEISNENALKWLYVALIVSRIIATSRSYNVIIKITVQKSCRVCHNVIMMWI